MNSTGKRRTGASKTDKDCYEGGGGDNEGLDNKFKDTNDEKQQKKGGLSDSQMTVLVLLIIFLGFTWLNRGAGGRGGMQYTGERVVAVDQGNSNNYRSGAIIGSASSVNGEISKLEAANMKLEKELAEVTKINEGLRGRVEQKRKERGYAAPTAPVVRAPDPVAEVPQAPVVSPKPDLRSIDVSTIPSYTGYTFWSSDMHISPIADVKDLFAPNVLNQIVIDKSLSGHCKIMKPPTCATDLKVLNSGNAEHLETDLGARGCPNKIKRQFFNEYMNDPEMKKVRRRGANRRAKGPSYFWSDQHNMQHQTTKLLCHHNSSFLTLASLISPVGGRFPLQPHRCDVRGLHGLR